MKPLILTALIASSLILMLTSSGCKSPQKPLTPIPQSPPPKITQPAPTKPFIPEGGTLGNGQKITETPLKTDQQGNVELNNLERFEDRKADREIFKAYTIHFDFDRSEIKPNDIPNLEAIADYLKKNPNDDLLIEGHCDERGTEKYNLALGERRALSAREYLIKLGVSASRIRTISYGEERPVDPGHNEEAWAKNRRAEFLRLLPKE